MALPFNVDAVKRNARAYGFSTQQSATFAHLAVAKLRDLHAASNQPVPLERIAEAIKLHACQEVERERAIRPEVRQRGISIMDDMEEELRLLDHVANIRTTIVVEERGGSRARRFQFDGDGLDAYFGKKDPYSSSHRDMQQTLSLQQQQHQRRDIITALCARIELAVELGKWLGPRDIVNLYATSRTFHNAVNEHLLSSIRAWIAHRAPEAGRLFKFNLYRRHLVPDPAGRTWQTHYAGTETQTSMPQLMRRIRTVPGLRYLQLVLGRDRHCREILAVMARNGLLMPKTMHHTLLRLWLLMDIATSGQRQALLRNQDMWTDEHLYNAQMFLVKLSMLFNDPIYGPMTNELLRVTMGQKGLYPLWQLLLRKRFTNVAEIVELQVRYDWEPPRQLYAAAGSRPDEAVVIHGVPLQEVGRDHLEGWGLGEAHLLRPDELIPLEAVARGLELDSHLMYMMTWGYVDFETGDNVVPSEDDVHMSDEEDALGHADTSGHWKRKHALKKRFGALSPESQRQIMQDDEDDRLKALAWTGDTTDYYCCHDGGDGADDADDADAREAYSLEDEITRGFIVNRQDGTGPAPPASSSDRVAWQGFVDQALANVPADLGDEQALGAQAWQNYHNDELYNDWDWQTWLRQEEQGQGARDSGPWTWEAPPHEEAGAQAPAHPSGDGDGDGDGDSDDTVILDRLVDDGNDHDRDRDHDGNDHDGPHRQLCSELADYFAADADNPVPGEQLKALLAEHCPQVLSGAEYPADAGEACRPSSPGDPGWGHVLTE
ncbi:uncharacterized protein UV8b_04968 [Ustilaginoidea virens]|uniref:Histidine kinase group protein n=1 Tax=Ustilaginoidea virens TaxID=1159556 RepID=A0A063BLT6_USTVR|nr:uncharacterized protein UV8b_04968 [Ustilaginoidea virens]QUC20727.1 hypothetical protein UV8b_04968 [Ustilaginoidea virens]GAO19276.1 hypothetical protein UVI_02062560 [Ustilaginoidea virens]